MTEKDARPELLNEQQVRRILSAHPERAERQHVLEEWMQQRDPGEVAFTFSQVYRDLLPLSDPVVEIYDDEDSPDSPPIYEGLAGEAYRQLVAGDYQATAVDGPVIVRVTDTASAVISPPVRPEDVASAVEQPL